MLSNGSTQGGLTNGALRIESTSGITLDVGSKNDGFGHFYTNSLYGFYLGNNLWVKGYLKAYNRDFEFHTGSYMRMVIDEVSGNVGIGNNYYPSSAFKLDVQGDIAINHAHFTSDKRLKKNINKLPESTVERIYSLNGWSYYLDDLNDSGKDYSAGKNGNDTISNDPPAQPDTTLNFGFIAQEVQAIYPELVKERDNGYLTVDYISLMPILLEALKYHNERMEVIEEEVKIKDKSTKAADEAYYVSHKAYLSQNRPNPFSENTLIEFSLPEEVVLATMYIYDMNGTQLRSIPLHQRGEGSVEISGGELRAGMYMYTMIADGQVIDTKQMFLTE